MGYKSRSNYALALGLSEEEFNKIFKKIMKGRKMKKVELKHAEVITKYKSNDTYSIKEIEGKGTIVNFNVKVKVNDRADRSPVIYEKCKYFSESSENVNSIKNILKEGTIVNIKGYEDKNSFQNKSGEKIYYNQINVSEIDVISSETDSEEDNLPF